MRALPDDDAAVLALLRVRHDVVDEGVGAGFVEGHLDEAALRRQQGQHLRLLLKIPMPMRLLSKLVGLQQ